MGSMQGLHRYGESLGEHWGRRGRLRSWWNSLGRCLQDSCICGRGVLESQGERGTGRVEQRRERGGERGAEAAKEKAKESESERAPRTERDTHTQERKERTRSDSEEERGRTHRRGGKWGWGEGENREGRKDEGELGQSHAEQRAEQVKSQRTSPQCSPASPSHCSAHALHPHPRRCWPGREAGAWQVLVCPPLGMIGWT